MGARGGAASTNARKAWYRSSAGLVLVLLWRSSGRKRVDERLSAHRLLGGLLCAIFPPPPPPVCLATPSHSSGCQEPPMQNECCSR